MKFFLCWLFYSFASYSFTLIAHKGFHNNHANEYGKCSTLNLIDMGAEHGENTFAAVEKALFYGADMAEIDLQLTKDGKLVVFHDSELDCKTNGKGKISDYTLKELKKLDAYYNLSFDGGKSYPLRGRGVREIRELSEYIKKFPNTPFHFNPKGKTDAELERLINVLRLMSKESRSKSAFWGALWQYKKIKKVFPEFGIFLTNGWQTLHCLNFVRIWPLILSWGIFPNSCKWYNNITIDLDDYFPYGFDYYSQYFIKNGIHLWGYNVIDPSQAEKLKDLGWAGVITPNIKAFYAK